MKMGGLFSRIFNTNYEYRILLQGLDASGKTTLLYRLKLGQVVTTIPTIGFNVETLTFKNINLIAWDVGGRDKIRPLLRHYYPTTKAVIFIIDSLDRERIDQARDELHAMLAEDDLRDCPVVVMANKQDLPNIMTCDEIAQELKLSTIKQDCAIFATSAVKGEGLAESMEWMISRLGHEGFQTGLTAPVLDTLQDVKDTATNSKTTLKQYLHYPIETLKAWLAGFHS